MVLDPLAQIDPITIGAVVAIFLATYLVLRRMFFAPFLDVLEKRARRIETARALRTEAEDLLKDGRARAEQLLAAAREEAGRISEAAREERLRLRESTMARATAEAEALLARGREEVLALRRSEESALGEHLHVCVGETLARMIGRVDDASVRYLVGRALAKGPR